MLNKTAYPVKLYKTYKQPQGDRILFLQKKDRSPLGNIRYFNACCPYSGKSRKAQMIKARKAHRPAFQARGLRCSPPSYRG